MLNILKKVKADKTPSAKFYIHRQLAGWEPARSHKILHASDLMKDGEFCPRQFAILDLAEKTKKDSYVGTAQAVTFAHGRGLEWNIRNIWMRDVVIGNWKCEVCNHLMESFSRVPKVSCPHCGYKKWEYKEPVFDSMESGISGSIDGLFNIDTMKNRLLEIKSIDKDMFAKLVAPLAEHAFRTNLYMRLVEESNHPKKNLINVKEAHLLYVSKAYGVKDDSLAKEGIKDAPFSPFKEFIIKRDDTITQTPVNKAKALFMYRDNPEMVPCRICSMSLEKRAQSCPVNGTCFSGKYPEVVSWYEKGVPRHPNAKVIVGE